MRHVLSPSDCSSVPFLELMPAGGVCAITAELKNMRRSEAIAVALRPPHNHIIVNTDKQTFCVKKGLRQNTVNILI